jgi:protocatechuate 3,4-dioxygenase beta subunit
MRQAVLLLLAACSYKLAEGRGLLAFKKLVNPPKINNVCAMTEKDIEGPYYVPGAPFKVDTICTEMGETVLILSGNVLNANCSNPLSAVLDVWHADEDGVYSMFDGDNRRYHCRGKIQTDTQGYYKFFTSLPGYYPGRPRHVHVKVSSPGYKTLTAQIYFRDDPRRHEDTPDMEDPQCFGCMEESLTIDAPPIYDSYSKKMERVGTWNVFLQENTQQ